MSFRYIGNKSRIVGWVTDVIRQNLAPGALVADLMCGTASVSESLARAGFRVIASDKLRFPTLHAKARLLQSGRVNLAEFGIPYRKALAMLNSRKPVEAYFTMEFCPKGNPLNGSLPRNYLTAENAGKIDAIRSQIAKWKSEGLSQDGADLLLHDLILATNRVANISGTYGFYHKNWTSSSLASIEMIETEFIKHQMEHSVTQGDASIVASQCTSDAIYLDPPYTKRQYAGNYHLVETIALGDDPPVFGQGGLRDWKCDASDFCYKRKSADAFRGIFQSAQSQLIFVSYSEDAHLSKHELFDVCSEFGNVEVFENSIGRYRSNSRVSRNGDVLEFIFALEMNRAQQLRSG